MSKIFKIVRGSHQEAEVPPFEQIEVHTIVEFDVPDGANGYCELDLDFDKVSSRVLLTTVTSQSKR